MITTVLRLGIWDRCLLGNCEFLFVIKLTHAKWVSVLFFPYWDCQEIINIINEIVVYLKILWGSIKRGKKRKERKSFFFPKQLCFISPALQTHTDVSLKKRESKSEKGGKKVRDTMTPIYLHTIQQYPAVPAIDFSGTESPCWSAAAVST